MIAGRPILSRSFELLFAALASMLLVTAAHAQSLGVEPGERRPTLPEFEPGADTGLERPALPPLPADPATAAALAVPIERIVVDGSTVFSKRDIERVLAPFTGRALTSADLVAARDALTHLYVDHGYVTSGAIIPDQDVVDGAFTIYIVEGSVGEITTEGNQRIRDAYLHPRLRTATRAPVHLGRLRDALAVLQRNRFIDRIDAHLEPGSRRGESRLIVTIEEARQWALGVEMANDRSPSVGSTGITGDGLAANILGLNDTTRLRFQATEGYRDVDARFEMPVTRWDTTFRYRFRDTRIKVVEDPFDVLDIEARGRSHTLSLFQPLYRRDGHELWLELTGDWRQTSSKMLGMTFCFELTLPDCSTPTVSALRGGLQYTWSTRRDVVSARSLFSGGLPILGASVGGAPGSPDAQFFAWLGQLQWAHVLPESLLGSTLMFRGDAQLANDALLSVEKFSVGGRRTVRGYRENQMVRDNGAILSAEVRVPVWRTSLARPVIEIVPFMDWGYAWNEGPEPPTNQLWGAGIGLRFMPFEGTLGEFYWGGRIDSKQVRDDDAQDHGIHFRVRVDAPDVF